MFISVKPVSFTDLELERIYAAISFAYDDLADSFSSDPDDYSEPLVDFTKEELDVLYGILNKIDTCGIFSDSVGSKKGVYYREGGEGL